MKCLLQDYWVMKTKGETRVLGGSKWDGEEPGDPLNWSPPPLVGAPEILCWECYEKLWLFGVGLNRLPHSRTKTKSSLGKAPSSLFPAFGRVFVIVRWWALRGQQVGYKHTDRSDGMSMVMVSSTWKEYPWCLYNSSHLSSPKPVSRSGGKS